MKKLMTIMAALLFAGCEYSEQDRKEFYQSCMEEYLSQADDFLSAIATSCACQNWSIREDIKPRNEEKRFDQIIQERDKCYSNPTKMDYSQRKLFLAGCQRQFTETYRSAAEQMLMGGMPLHAISEYGILVPGFYERGSNSRLIECACTRISFKDDFIIPPTITGLEKLVEKESKECEKIWSEK